MLEVCVDTIKSAELAEEFGAERIELCSALELGGVTPSGPLISAVRRTIQLPLIVLIRCRAGNFQFDPEEHELMLQEAKQAFLQGADGIAIGGLTHSQDLDLPFLRSIANAFRGRQLVMHRAFDQVREPYVALEQLIEIGFARILTSGGTNLAIDSLASIRQLVQRSQNRIEILPAGGITDENALEILELTGVNQLHGSFRNPSIQYRLDPNSIARAKRILSSHQQLGHDASCNH